MQLRFHVAERRELRHAIAMELRRTPIGLENYFAGLRNR